MIWLYLSTEQMTVGVEVVLSTGIIADAPPIVRRFIGQHINNLRRWMMKQAGYLEKVLS